MAPCTLARCPDCPQYHECWDAPDDMPTDTPRVPSLPPRIDPKAARHLGQSDAARRLPSKFRRSAVGVYERRVSVDAGSIYRGGMWFAVDDPTEAIAYLEGYEGGVGL